MFEFEWSWRWSTSSTCLNLIELDHPCTRDLSHLIQYFFWISFTVMTCRVSFCAILNVQNVMVQTLIYVWYKFWPRVYLVDRVKTCANGAVLIYWYPNPCKMCTMWKKVWSWIAYQDLCQCSISRLGILCSSWEIVFSSTSIGVDHKMVFYVCQIQNGKCLRRLEILRPDILRESDHNPHPLVDREWFTG